MKVQPSVGRNKAILKFGLWQLLGDLSIALSRTTLFSQVYFVCMRKRMSRFAGSIESNSLVASFFRVSSRYLEHR